MAVNLPPAALSDWLSRALEWLAALLLMALMALTCADVVGRYVFNAPVDGATELTELLLAGIIFAALPAVGWRGEHINVDLLDKAFSSTLWVRLRPSLMDLACAAMLAAVAWQVWLLAARHAEYGDRTVYLHIPVAPVVYGIGALCAGAALVLVLAAVSRR